MCTQNRQETYVDKPIEPRGSNDLYRLEVDDTAIRKTVRREQSSARINTKDSIMVVHK